MSDLATHSLMFTIQIKNVCTGKAEHGTDRPLPKRTKIKAEFSSRQKARNWCRNQWYQHLHNGMVIVHPDGKEEDFEWNGLTNL